MRFLKFLSRLLLRHEVSLHLVGGQTIRFRCRTYNIRYNTGSQRLTSLKAEGCKGFPFHIVLEDVSAITTRLVTI